MNPQRARELADELVHEDHSRRGMGRGLGCRLGCGHAPHMLRQRPDRQPVQGGVMFAVTLVALSIAVLALALERAREVSRHE